MSVTCRGAASPVSHSRWHRQGGGSRSAPCQPPSAPPSARRRHGMGREGTRGAGHHPEGTTRPPCSPPIPHILSVRAPPAPRAAWRGPRRRAGCAASAGVHGDVSVPCAPPSAGKGSMSLFQTVTAPWSPPSPIIRKERGVSAPTPPQKQPLLALPAAPSSPPPAQGTAPRLGLTCFCFCLAWGEKRQRLVTVKWGPPPGPPRFPWAKICPYLRRGEAIAGSHCRRGPRHCQLSWGRRG